MKAVIAVVLLAGCASTGGSSCPGELPQIMPNVTRRQATGSSLRVRVIDHLTDGRIPGSAVIVTQGAQRDSMMTLANGEASFGDLEPGAITVVVRGNGYRSRLDSFTLGRAEVFEASLRLNPVPPGPCGE